MIPVTPEPRPGCTADIIAKSQPQYIPLPANFRRPYVETKWRFTWLERLRVLFFGHLYLTIKTFGGPLQPLRPTVKRDSNLGGTA